MRTVEKEAMKLSTNDLEAYLDLRYESGAPQAELEALETAFAGRVSEDDLQMTEAEIDLSEETGFNGGNLELELVDAYRRYLQPDGKRDGAMTKEEVVRFMRTIIEDSRGINKGTKQVRDAQILSAAKDIYDHRKELIQRQKSKLKLTHIPTRLSKLIKIIDKNRPQDDNTN